LPLALALASVATQARASGGYAPVTAAERAQTRAVVAVVLDAFRRGESWRLCAVLSQRTAGGPRDRCEAETRRLPSRPSGLRVPRPRVAGA
jgi:hypothetical protein